MPGGLGLLDGLELASIVVIAGVSTRPPMLSLIGLNTGIETGMLLLACAIVPLASHLPRTQLVQRRILRLRSEENHG